MNRIFLAVILANTVVLTAGLIRHDWEHALEPLHTVFLAVFVFELGWRWFKHRERGGWMAFDSVIVALALLPILGTSVDVLRIARLARVTHTLRHATHLRNITLLRVFDVFNRKKPVAQPGSVLYDNERLRQQAETQKEGVR